jgi:positive regulator of sigma E activity
MRLRPLAISGGALTAVVLLPLIVAFAAVGRPDVARGLLLGLLLGLLNSLLLARKLDRVIDGREAWQSLGSTMPRNVLVRFMVIGAVAAMAARTPGINVVAMIGGLALSVLMSLVYAAWAVLMRWRKEDRALARSRP